VYFCIIKPAVSFAKTFQKVYNSAIKLVFFKKNVIITAIDGIVMFEQIFFFTIKNILTKPVLKIKKVDRLINICYILI
jgi:hypothetical protein